MMRFNSDNVHEHDMKLTIRRSGRACEWVLGLHARR